jgi:hypothetical protein
MNIKNFVFSTPMVNPECPFGLKNPVVIITDGKTWQLRNRLEQDTNLDNWARKQGLGELESNIYQANNAVEAEAISNLLSSKGMTHDPSLDTLLQEIFAEMA